MQLEIFVIGAILGVVCLWWLTTITPILIERDVRYSEYLIRMPVGTIIDQRYKGERWNHIRKRREYSGNDRCIVSSRIQPSLYDVEVIDERAPYAREHIEDSSFLMKRASYRYGRPPHPPSCISQSQDRNSENGKGIGMCILLSTALT